MSHDDEMDFEMNHEFTELAQALRESRPTPEPEFTGRLDQAVADHFPPEWADEAALGKQGRGGIGNLTERFRRRLGGRRILLPAMAGFAGILLVATVVVSAVDSGKFGSGGSDGGDQTITDRAANSAASSEQTGGGDMAMPESETRLGTADSVTAGGADPAAPSSRGEFQLNALSAGKGTVLAKKGKRDVAREAEITLGTDPDGVQDVANKIVSVTDDHHGIVMKSEVTDGEEGVAGASFKLMIPSGQIESAVADLSGIADLKSRNQELTDITAPTHDARDDVADSEAKIKSLLGELEVTYDEDERAAIEQKIRWERNDKRWAENRLNRLERRADYTPVDLRVETGGDSASDDGSAGWGLGDAVDDAGKLLGVAAGVTVLALAVAIPIGIVLLIALALNRAWVRRSRRRVLADD
jgi:hypothetical protein